jgi:lysozyme
MGSIDRLLIQHEGLRLKVYDDATGQPIGPGDTLKGHPTIGIGRCLDLNGITEEEALSLFEEDLKVSFEEAEKLPFFHELDSVRQDIMVMMVFNLGLPRLLGFKKTLAYLKNKDYEAAAEEMLDSLWARQVGKRAHELSAMMRTGAYI